MSSGACPPGHVFADITASARDVTDQASLLVPHAVLEAQRRLVRAAADDEAEVERQPHALGGGAARQVGGEGAAAAAALDLVERGAPVEAAGQARSPDDRTAGASSDPGADVDGGRVGELRRRRRPLQLAQGRRAAAGIEGLAPSANGSGCQRSRPSTPLASLGRCSTTVDAYRSSSGAPVEGSRARCCSTCR